MPGNFYLFSKFSTTNIIFVIREILLILHFISIISDYLPVSFICLLHTHSHYCRHQLLYWKRDESSLRSLPATTLQMTSLRKISLAAIFSPFQNPFFTGFLRTRNPGTPTVLLSETSLSCRLRCICVSRLRVSWTRVWYWLPRARILSTAVLRSLRRFR